MRQNDSKSDEVVIKKLLSKYSNWWYLFLICIVLALGVAYMFNILSEPVYLAKTSLMIGRESTPSPIMPDNVRPRNRDSWHNEKAILQSRTLIDRALQIMEADVSYYEIEHILGLSSRREIYKDSPFRVKWDNNTPQLFGIRFRVTILSEFSYKLEEINKSKSRIDSAIIQFGELLEGQRHSFLLDFVVPFDEEKHKNKVYEFVIHNNSQLIYQYLSNLEIESMGTEYSIVEIAFEATNQQRALDFLSNLTDMYIKQNLDEKYRTAQNTMLFVDNQMAEVSKDLEDTELSLQQFRQRHQIMEVGPVATRLSQELEDLDRQKSVEEVKRQYYDLLMDYVRDDLEFTEVFGPSALGIDDPILNSLLMDLSKLHSERARMLLTTTVSTPSVKAIEENIRLSKANLQENIQNLKAASNIMINDLNQRISEIEMRINEMPHTERELINIQRLFNLSETTYTFLMERRAEAGIGLASMIPDHNIVDPAHSIGTISPMVTLNYTIAFCFGTIIPVIFLVARSFFNTRIIEIEDVNRETDFPIVGLVPHFPKINKLRDPNPVLFDVSKADIVEAFRSMRSNLMLVSPKTKSKLIVVTSTREKEGKTFTSLNLAGSFSLLNRKTIYINADMRKPSILFDLNAGKDWGLSTYLTGQIDYDDLINQSGNDENLHLIPSGKIPPNAAELLESEAMDQLLERLRSFEYIIIDTPPVGLVSDAKSLLTRADIVLYILRHGYSQQMDLAFLRELGRNASLKKVTIAINDVKKNKHKGYGYGYNYGYGYGVGYGAETKAAK